MPDLTHRCETLEMLDDQSIIDDRLTKSLDQLRVVNHFLGGYSSVFDAIFPYMERHQARKVRILDVGAGIGDIAAFLLQDTGIRRWDVEITLVDLNPATSSYALQWQIDNLDKSVLDRISILSADAMHLPFRNGAFDIVIASMFLHHFPAKSAIAVMREMNRVARDGVLINDLQRHEFAYAGIYALTRLLHATQAVRNDGPLSVARGFSRPELYRIARKAGLINIRIRWKWAFRWVMVSGRL